MLALLLLPLTVFLIAVLGCAILLTSRGPVFFRQQRVGQNGKPFRIWKLRTMHAGERAWVRGTACFSERERAEWAMNHKLRNDPRITKLGRILRASSLDELPQILNILAGEMSFVGPRPVTAVEIPKYSEYASYYLAAKPGITGLWQVSGRSSLPYDMRVMLDVSYVSNWTMAMDLSILMQTPRAAIRQEGAY